MAFTSQITGSPFTTPHANISAMAYVNIGGVKRIYYAQGGDFTKIFCMSTSGTADTSREINVQNQGDARTSPIRGLCSDGTYLYAITGALGNQYIHVYRLSDRTYRANTPLGFHADHYARGIETFPRPGRTTEKRINILQDNIVRSYQAVVTASSITLSQQNDGTFALPTNEMVTSGNWQSIAWDDTVDRLLIVAEQSAPNERDKVFGFTYTGARDDREDFLPGVDIDAMTYNGDDDDLYMVHETSTNLYAWGDAPRWQLGNTDLNITEGQTYILDLKPLVDTGATITARNAYTTQTGLQNANLTDGVFTWTDPPAPTGGRAHQPFTLTFRATLGANHTDQRFNFILNAAVTPYVPVSWRTTTLPAQTVYEPYTPPAGAPTPNLSHGFAINLSDYIASGRDPITFSARHESGDLGGTFQITQRFVNQQAIRDRLVFNSSAVARSSSGVIAVTASNENDAGSPTIVVAYITVNTINLVHPAWNSNSNQINIGDRSSHSINLRDLSTGEPQTDIEFVGTPPADINAAINNGILTLRSSLPRTTDSTEHFTAKLTNILTDTDGVQQTFDVNISAAQQPRSAPVWLPGPINISTDKGQTARIDLNQYIQSANPSPEFGVSAPEGVLATIRGSISGQHFLEYTIPSTITEDTAYSVDVTATNDLDSAVKTIVITGNAETIPVVGNIPRQAATNNEMWSVDLSPFVTGKTPITYTFDPSYTVPSTMALDGSRLSYTPSNVEQDTSILVPLVIANEDGTVNYSLQIFLLAHNPPIWDMPAIEFEVLEGQSETFDLNRYISGTRPITMRFAPTYSHADLEISINNNQLQITRAPTVDTDTYYNIPVLADSEYGNAEKTITLKVLARIAMEEIHSFTQDDYNEIRYLLGFEITTDELPDTVIQSSIYEQAGIDWVIQALPANPSRTLLNLRRKKRAALYRCASIIAGHVPELVSENVAGASKLFGTTSWIDRSADLFVKAQREVDLVKLDEKGLTDYNFFEVTRRY